MNLISKKTKNKTDLSEVVISSDSSNETLINISNKNKAEILAKLYNNILITKFKHSNRFITTEEAQSFLNETNYIYTIDGYIIDIDFSGDTINVKTYDDNYGINSAERIIIMCHDIL